MQQIPKPPIGNPISISLGWNELAATSRTHLMSQWENQLGTAPDESLGNFPEIALTSETSAAFWEKGWVEPMKKLPEAIALTGQFPERYNRKLFYNPKTLAAPIDEKFAYCLHTQPEMSERDALLDFDRYLDTVSDVAVQNGDDEVVSQVSVFRNELGYLSEADFDNGSEVIAKGWIDYLGEHPNARINVFDPPSKRPKSNGYTLQKVITSANEQLGIAQPEQASSLRERIKTNPETWEDTPDSKLVIVDDWVISGGSSADFVKRAKQEADERGLSGLNDKTEVHAVARSDSADEPRGFTYRSVFLQDSGLPYRDVSMTGAHCTVNYGYEHQLRAMQEYAQSRGIFLEAPHLFKLKPAEYRVEDMRQLEEVATRELVATLARDNSAAIKSLQRIHQLDTAMQDVLDRKTDGTKHDLANEVEDIGSRRVMYTVLLDRLGQRRGQLRKDMGLPKKGV